MILLTHPTGNQNVRQALLAFYEAGLLTEFVTTVAAFDGNLFGKLAKTKLGGEFERRRYMQQFENLTKQHPLKELGRLLSLQLGLNGLVSHERGLFCVDAVYNDLDRFSVKQVINLLDKTELSVVYGYEDGILETFKVAKELGLKCVYDLPIAYCRTGRKILQEEMVRLPEWGPTLIGCRDSEKKLKRKDLELELADVIICPSAFVRDSLPDEVRKSKPVFVIPFGSPEILKSDFRNKVRHSNQIQVLFAGSMSQRKGLADVFEAMKLLNPEHFQLHVLGNTVVDLAFYKQQFPNFIYHPPCSHSNVLKLMQSCDVFVLPSLVEGRALVQQEALACGLPIIVTKNAGAEDLVEDEQAGFLVPIRNPQAIAEKLQILNQDRERLSKMQSAATIKAQQITWSEYRRKLIEALGLLRIESNEKKTIL